MILFCQKCGSKNNEDAVFCVSCGNSFKKGNTSSIRALLVTGIVLSVLALVGVGYMFMTTIFEKEKVVELVENTPPKEEPNKTPTVKIEKDPKPIVKDSTPEREKTVIIKETMPKVFTIFTRDSLGSGFLYKKGGLIITNAHVVAGYTDVVVRNSSGKDSPGKVIGISDLYDVALIQVADYANAEPLSIDMNESAIGTEVIALGSPQGFENSASIGYLTGIGRHLELDFIYENVYQIDAQIDQGSSGGPLLDAKTGKVIGINSLLFTNNVSFGFSIPMHSMYNLIDSWAKHPMSENEVASVFGVYDDFYYDESASAKADSYYDEYLDGFGLYFDEYTLENFILYFRDYYEWALNEEDFFWIEDLLLPGSTAYYELEDYIREISGEGYLFDFISNSVTDIEIYDDFAIVSTIEEFDFYNAAGNVTYYERIKEYMVVIDEYGNYMITDIYIY